MFIRLNQNEANVLIQMIDIAVKSQGLKVAEAAIHLVRLISSPVQEKEQQESSEITKLEPSNEGSDVTNCVDTDDISDTAWCYNCNRPATNCVCESWDSKA